MSKRDSVLKIRRRIAATYKRLLRELVKQDAALASLERTLKGRV